MLVRMQAWQQIGPLDPGYFMYCEEIDWCIRARRAGWDIYCVPQAHIVHYAGQSTRQFKAAMYVALWRSRYRLFRLYYSKLYQQLARLIVRAGMAKQIRDVRHQVAVGELSLDAGKLMMEAYQQVKEL